MIIMIMFIVSSFHSSQRSIQLQRFWQCHVKIAIMQSYH